MAFLKCVNARETSWSLSLLFPLHTEQTESKMFSLQGSVPKLFLSFLLSLGFFIMDDLLLLCLTGILNEEIVTQISSQEGFYHWKQIFNCFVKVFLRFHRNSSSYEKSLCFTITTSFLTAFLKCINDRDTSWSLSLLFPLHTEQTKMLFSLQGAGPKLFFFFCLSLGFLTLETLLFLFLTTIL